VKELLSCSEVMLKDNGRRRLRLRCIQVDDTENKLWEYKGRKVGPYKDVLKGRSYSDRSVERGSRVYKVNEIYLL